MPAINPYYWRFRMHIRLENLLAGTNAPSASENGPASAMAALSAEFAGQLRRLVHDAGSEIALRWLEVDVPGHKDQTHRDKQAHTHAMFTHFARTAAVARRRTLAQMRWPRSTRCP